MIRFKKRLQDLKVLIRQWIKTKKSDISSNKHDIVNELREIDKKMDRGEVDEATVLRRFKLKNNLIKINDMEAKDNLQKSKVKWAIEGDENSKFFHRIINKKRSQLAIRGRLTSSQAEDLKRSVSNDEIRRAVWNCGDNKSPGPDGFTFEFFKRFWDLIGADFYDAFNHFFVYDAFSNGCNSSFIALIPKVIDAKFVNDFRPISLIGCIYKVVTKVLANRLVSVIQELISDTQSAFVAGRQILDGPFILDEILYWCKRKNKKSIFFKVDFAKAYDSVRWDYLLDVLEAFGFGHTWRQWIRGTLSSARASVLINGSPSKEISCHRGLKQGDPLAPYLFILIMESLHLSFSKAVEEGLFKGIQLSGSTFISHLLYADDAMFLGEWSEGNLKEQAAASVGCTVMNPQFRYLGVTVGHHPISIKAWDDIIFKLRGRLFKWKTIRALYGQSIDSHPTKWSSNWCSILREVDHPKEQGFDFRSHCKKRIGNVVSVADKLNGSLADSFRRDVRGGRESHQMETLNSLLASVSLSNSCDQWFCDLAADGEFQVKEVRNFIDDLTLPSQSEPTRWGFTLILLHALSVIPMRKMCIISSFAAILPGLSYVAFVRGGIWVSTIGLRSRSGMPGLLRFVFLPRSSYYWRRSFVFLGGLFGSFEITLFLKRVLPNARRFLMILFFVLLTGVLVVLVENFPFLV
nr:RNA-directed DNA polymerase, eukaryota [Tanacetum cinerariifolium]